MKFNHLLKIFAFYILLPFLSFSQSEANTLTGSFSITDGGAATYHLPIDLPIGTSGFGPQISINYNSNSGNGILGQGWSLTGLSSVKREGQNYSQDGRKTSVQFNYDDRFSLNGQRLIEIKGKGYGNDGAEYFTEVNSFSIIKSLGSSASGPQTFVEKTKEGITNTYGGSGQVLIPQGKENHQIFEWLINKSEDNYGNYIKYEYIFDKVNSTYYPSKISYTGHPLLTSEFFNVIEFSYETRTDSIESYFKASKFKINKRLKEIAIRYNNITFKKFTFQYGGDINLTSILQTITESDKDGNTNTISVDWIKSEEIGFENKINDVIPRDLLKGEFNSYYDADWNSDGLIDIMVHNKSTNQVSFLFNNGNNSFKKIYSVLDNISKDDQIIVADFNSDGRVDLFHFNPTTGTNICLLNSEYKNDELKFLTGIPNQIDVSHLKKSNNITPNLYLTEWNGDGRIDLAVIIRDPKIQNQTFFYLNNSTSPANFVLNQVQNINEKIRKQDIDYIYNRFNISDWDNDGTYDVLIYDVTSPGSTPNTPNNPGGNQRWLRGIYDEKLNTIEFKLKGINLIPPDQFRSNYLQEAIIDATNFPYHTSNLGHSFIDYNKDGNTDIVYNTYDFVDAIPQPNVPEEYTVYSFNQNHRIQGIGDWKFLWKEIVTPFAPWNRACLNKCSQPNSGRTQHYVIAFFGVSKLWYQNDTIYNDFFADIDGNLSLDKIDLKTSFYDYTQSGTADANPVVGKQLDVKYDYSKGNNLFKLNNKNLVNFSNLDKNNFAQTWSNIQIGQFSKNSQNDILIINRITGENQLFINKVKSSPPLVKGINTNLGKAPQIIIEYETLNDNISYKMGNDGNYPLMDFTSNLPIVTNYHLYSFSEGDTVLTNKYSYRDAKYDVSGRGYLGFKEIQIFNVQSNTITKKYFDQSTQNSGSPLIKQEIYHNSKLSSITEYKVKEVVKTNFVTNFLTNNKVYTSFITNADSRAYDINGDLVSHSTMTQDMDLLGNLIFNTMDYHNGEKDSTSFTYFEYDNPSNSLSSDVWHIGRLKTSEIYRFGNNDRVIHKKVSFEYNLNGSLSKEIVEPDKDPQKNSIKSYEYDAFGNILKSTIYAYNGIAFETRTTFTKYDVQGRFIVETKNDLNHIEKRKYHDFFGHPESITDINNLVTKYEYNGFGKLIKKTNPDNTFEKVFNEIVDGLNKDIIKQVSTNSISSAQTTIFDYLGRERISYKKNFNGIDIYSSTSFNNKGLPDKLFNPSFEQFQDLDSAPSINIVYDERGREIIRNFPNGKSKKTSYDGLKQTVTFSDQQYKIISKDLKGRTINIKDHENNSIEYKYNPENDLEEIALDNGYKIKYNYDDFSRLVSVDDSLKGSSSFIYNGFGEKIQDKNGKNEITKYEYDKIGRLVKIIRPEGESIFEYDSKPNGKGKLAKVSHGPLQKDYSYDSFSRISSEKITIDGKSYDFIYSYDNKSRLESTKYPSGLIIKNLYNAEGYLHKVVDGKDNKPYWELLDMDEKERVTKYKSGNNVITQIEYANFDDYITKIRSTRGALIIQDLSYEFDLFDNVISISDNVKKKKRDYEYDRQNRITKEYLIDLVNNQYLDTLSMSYDKYGNILSKSDFGVFKYGVGGHNNYKIQSVILNDPNKICAEFTTDFSFSSFDKLLKIENDTAQLNLFYNEGNQRYKQEIVLNTKILETKFYVNPLLEITENNTGTKLEQYINTPIGIIGVVENLNGVNEILYYHKDHLNSINKITNDQATILVDQEFSLWGSRISSISTNEKRSRGFTSHEHIDLFGLINMNGRIYSPSLGRFLSVDPIIEDITDYNAFNRYTYVSNNPITFNDPTGHFKISRGLKYFSRGVKNLLKGNTKGLGQIFQGFSDVTGIGSSIKEINLRGKKIFGSEDWNTIVVIGVSVAVTYATGGFGAPGMAVGFETAILSGAASGAAGAGLSTYFAGGNLDNIIFSAVQGGVFSGLSAGLTHGVGSIAKGYEETPFTQFGIQTIGHSTVQGGISVLRGGKFEHGAFNGLIGNASASVAGKLNFGFYSGLVSSTVAGGAASLVTGDKFINGASSGAFIYLFNHKAAHLKKVGKIYGDQLKDQIQDKLTSVEEYGSHYRPPGWKPSGTSIDNIRDADYPTGLILGEWLKEYLFPTKILNKDSYIKFKPIPCDTCNPNLD
jgi:RHS repeat-associated protein